MVVNKDWISQSLSFIYRLLIFYYKGSTVWLTGASGASVQWSYCWTAFSFLVSPHLWTILLEIPFREASYVTTTK